MFLFNKIKFNDTIFIILTINFIKRYLFPIYGTVYNLGHILIHFHEVSFRYCINTEGELIISWKCDGINAIMKLMISSKQIL